MRTITISPDLDVTALVGKRLMFAFGTATVVQAFRTTRTYQGLGLELMVDRKSTYWGGPDGSTIVVID